MKTKNAFSVSLLPWGASALAAFLFLAPLLWMFFASFRIESTIFDTSFSNWLSPDGWTTEHYPDAWRRAQLGQAFINSLLQVAGICSIGLLINAMAAYAFARLYFRGRNILFALVVMLIILPIEVMAIPLFFTSRDLGLTGGYLPAMGGLIIPFLAKAFNIYFLRQHFLSVPIELEEAAAIDGASAWRQFWNISLPAIRPALATVVVLDLLFHWGDFLWPLMISTREETRTVQISLANLFTQPPIQWGDILACSVLATLPVLLLFRFLQRYIVATNSHSGIK